MGAGSTTAPKTRTSRSGSLSTLQKFTSVHAALHNHFNHERHLIDRKTDKANRSAAMAEWRTLAT